MAGDLLTERVLLAGAVVLLMIGAVSAWTSGNLIKRVAAIALAQIGAVTALAVLGAPAPALMGGVTAAFAQLILGVSIIVRVQESYGAVEASEIDAADAQSEPVAEPRP